MSRRFSLALPIIVVLGPAVLATPVRAQTCEEELARQDAALRQLDADARREGVAFVLDDLRRGALGEVSKRLRGDATADAAREIKARWDEYQAYVNQGRTFQTVAEELSRCLRGGAASCLAQVKEGVQRHIAATALAERIGEAVLQWIASLGNEAISRAAERVDRARSIMQNFTNRAAGTATQAATRGLDSCLRDFDRRVQQAQNNATPVDPRQPPTGGPPPKTGVSAGKLAALIAIPAATAGALVYANGVINQANDAAAGDTSSSTPSQIRLVIGPRVIQCTRVGGASLQSRCVGDRDIVLDVGSVFGGGTQVCIRTDPSAFLDCEVKGSSSQMAFQIDERIINVDFNGNISACRPIQTGIFVYSGAATGVAATARVSANIPVTCN